MRDGAQYKPQLEAVRAFAVLGVLAHHFYYFGSSHGYAAGAGVRLFFVLSGFLITDILLRAADQAEAGHATRLESSKSSSTWSGHGSS